MFENFAKNCKKLHLSGYFIQLLRYTAGARCSKYYSTPPLGRDCKPCIRIKSLTQKGKGGGFGSAAGGRDDWRFL